MIHLEMAIGDQKLKFSFKTSLEAAKFVANLQRESRGTRKGPRPNDTADLDSEGSPSERSADRALKALLAIQESHNGLTSKQLASKLGMRDARGLGMIRGTITTLLAEKGLSISDVLDQKRGPDHERMWIARDRIADAIIALGGVVEEEEEEEKGGGFADDDLPF